ncbi:MAG: SDR family NAD(P)-dependent oxidoreductase [Alphaproteobacteria bacterium]|nr:SDR family NAD(P)-dependent oxidoreductase [Alphaproteobacteria bacterium]
MPSVLITGASRGLGLEFARQFAGDGWRVMACTRDPDGAALKAVGGQISRHRLDVTDPDQISALAGVLKDEAIDVLINNSGIYGQPRGRGAWGDIDYAI